MKLARVATSSGPRYARIENHAGREVAVLLRGTVGSFTDDGVVPLAGLTLLAPVEPTKIVAIGSNYVAHAAEMGMAVPAVPKLFLKPSTAVVGPGEAIRIPPGTERVDPEGELGVVIGKRTFRADPAQAMANVLGYTCLNDVTARDFQRADVQFTRGKGFDSFCPIGPWVVGGIDASDLAIATVVNGERRAGGRTSDMVVRIPELISFISQIMTLLPGDVIATGTPPGVAPIVAGDVVEVVIEGIGTLSNPVMDREDR